MIANYGRIYAPGPRTKCVTCKFGQRRDPAYARKYQHLSIQYSALHTVLCVCVRAFDADARANLWVPNNINMRNGCAMQQFHYVHMVRELCARVLVVIG